MINKLVGKKLRRYVEKYHNKIEANSFEKMESKEVEES